MEIPNLRTGLSECVNDLNKILNNIDDAAQQDKILRLIRVYTTLWDEVIRQDILNNTPKYEKALDKLKKAEAATKQALEDMAEVATAIKRAASAAKAVAKVVGLLAGI